MSLALSANGQTLVSAGGDQTVRVWNLADGAQVRTIEAPAVISAAAWSRNEALLAVALADGTAKVYQFADGKELSTLSCGPARSLTFAADGLRLLIPGEKQAGLWDLGTAALMESLPVEAGCGALTATGEVATVTADKKVTRHTLHARALGRRSDQEDYEPGVQTRYRAVLHGFGGGPAVGF